MAEADLPEATLGADGLIRRPDGSLLTPPPSAEVCRICDTRRRDHEARHAFVPSGQYRFDGEPMTRDSALLDQLRGLEPIKPQPTRAERRAQQRASERERRKQRRRDISIEPKP